MKSFSPLKGNHHQAKAKAIAETGINIISSPQALEAHPCQSAVCNQSLGPEVDVNCLLSIGVRTGLQPQLPREYFGNVVQKGT